jgi:hypothetical protein
MSCWIWMLDCIAGHVTIELDGCWGLRSPDVMFVVLSNLWQSTVFFFFAACNTWTAQDRGDVSAFECCCIGTCLISRDGIQV